MAEYQTLARPYARAAFAVARDATALPQWEQALRQLAQASADASVAPLIGHPGLAHATLVDLLGAIAGAEAPQGLTALLRLLAENRKLTLLPFIAQEFAALRAAHERIRHVRIASASEVASAQRDAFTQALKQRLTVDVDVSWQVDPELIGGAVVAAGDLVIDGSVRGEIDRLRASLTQ